MREAKILSTPNLAQFLGNQELVVQEEAEGWAPQFSFVDGYYS